MTTDVLEKERPITQVEKKNVQPGEAQQAPITNKAKPTVEKLRANEHYNMHHDSVMFRGF